MLPYKFLAVSAAWVYLSNWRWFPCCLPYKFLGIVKCFSVARGKVHFWTSLPVVRWSLCLGLICAGIIFSLTIRCMALFIFGSLEVLCSALCSAEELACSAVCYFNFSTSCHTFSTICYWRVTTHILSGRVQSLTPLVNASQILCPAIISSLTNWCLFWLLCCKNVPSAIFSMGVGLGCFVLQVARVSSSFSILKCIN